MAPERSTLDLSHWPVAAAASLLEAAIEAGSGVALAVRHPDRAGLAAALRSAGALVAVSDAPVEGPCLRPAVGEPATPWLVEHWWRAVAGLAAAAARGRPTPVDASTPADAAGPAIDGLRVLFVCHEATRTGAPMALLGLMRWLVARGVRAHTLVLVDGPLRDDFGRLGPLLWAPGGRVSMGELPDVDVVYANTVVPSGLVAAMAERGATAVVHAHELLRAIEGIGVGEVRRGLIGARHLLAVSEPSEQALRTVLGALARPITRITEPLLPERFAEAEQLGLHDHDAAGGPFAVGGFGTFCHLKGGDLLARVSAGELPGGDGAWAFRWVGQHGDDAPGLLAQLAAAGVRPRLEHLGELQQPLVAVADFDVLALLSRQDSYPLAMLEAALVGVPTVAQRGSGGPEAFARTGGAAIVDAEDPVAVLRALDALRRHPALRTAMAAAGRAHVLAHNTVDAVGPTVAGVLASVASPAPVVIASDPSAPPAAPDVSIVTPVFNRVDMTERCLRALARTVDPTRVELIVVDNGSSDGSAELVRSLWPAAVVLRNAENRGFAKGCNQGVAAARADRVVLLNNDTEPCAGWLEALLAPLDEPDVGLVAPKLLFPDGTIQHAGMSLVEDRKRGLALNAVHDHYKASASVPAASVRRDLQLVTGAVLAMRRSVFNEVGGFDEGYWNGCEDVDLCLALAASGHRVVYEPAAVLVHHESASGAERWTKVNDNLRRLARKWLGRVRPDLVITEAGHVVPFGTAPAPSAGGRELTVALEGAVFGYHSLSQVNRELAVRLAASHGIEVIARSSEVPEVTVAEDRRLAPVVAASVAVPARRPAVTIRHQWPPDWSAPDDDAPLVVVQPWEFGGLPDDWIDPIRTLADEVWCYTTWVRDCYVRSGVPADRVRVLPIGVDRARFRPDGDRYPLQTRASVRLLFVGGLIHRKGIDVLLDAYRRAFGPGDDVCLVVKSFGGDGVYRNASGAALLREAVARADGPAIEWIDRDVDQAAMAALYRSCDVLVHPYRGEGFGMPIAEAMASGLAVVVTDDGAARDFCDDEVALLVRSRRVAIPPGSSDLPTSRAGYWIAEPDVESLAEQLRRIVDDAGLRARLGAAGRERVASRLDWDAIAAAAAARLRELAGRPARRVIAADPYRPDVPAHPLDDTRARTLLLVAGTGHRGWERAAAAVASAVGADDDVTVVIATDDGASPARDATLATLEACFADAPADVLVELDADDAVLAGLLVRCDATVAVDADWVARARRCAAATVTPDAPAIAAWVRPARAPGRAA